MQRRKTLSSCTLRNSEQRERIPSGSEETVGRCRETTLYCAVVNNIQLASACFITSAEKHLCEALSLDDKAKA